MARKPMTPQEYEDSYNRLPVDDTPLPESYVDRLHPKHIETMFRLKEVEAENERLSDLWLFVEEVLDFDLDRPLRLSELYLWVSKLQTHAAELLASAQTGGADDGSE